MEKAKRLLLGKITILGIGLFVLSMVLGCATLERKNIELVQRGYALFGQGDIEGFLDQMAEDIVWIIPGPPDIMAGAGIYHGPEGVAQFFEKLGGAIDFELFEPREYIAQGDMVVVLGHSRETVKPTGITVEFDWAGVYKIRGGKIVEYHVYEPTDGIVDAWRGE